MKAKMMPGSVYLYLSFITFHYKVDWLLRWRTKFNYLKLALTKICLNMRSMWKYFLIV